jgi:hypothetical protein
MPFNDDLKSAIGSDPIFAHSLKISHPNKYAMVPAVMISPPTVDGVAEVLGVFAINIGKLRQGKLFVIQDYLARWPDGWIHHTKRADRFNHPRVRSIDEFSTIFGQGVYYGNGNNQNPNFVDHHYRVMGEFNDDIRPTIIKTVRDTCDRLGIDPVPIIGQL